jgi:TolB-like protein/Flp pilus assembly protein TadD
LSLVNELKRRNVFKVVGSYAVVAWLLIEIVVTIEDPLGLPDWSDTLAIVALLMGFPVCAVLAWVYDFTGTGFERTAEAGAGDQAVAGGLSGADKRSITLSIAAALLLLATSAYLVIGRSPEQFDSLAVVAFDSAGIESDLQYLGNGIRDGLITRLSRLRALRIKPGSVGPGDRGDPRSLGRLLGVAVVCMGRISQRGNSLEFVADLIDTHDGSIIWRGEYSSQASSLVEIENQLSSEISRQLGLQLSEEDEAAVARAPTSNPAAHKLYLQGRYFWNRRTREGFAASIDFFKRALALDPNYALAHAGLADTYLMMLGWGMERPEVVAPSVMDAARRAIQLDSSLAEPHAVLGYLKTIYSRDWQGARAEFLQAIELNGNYSSAHHWYAFLLMTEGDMRSAIEEILLARELEPLSPIINAEVGYFHLFGGEPEKALEALHAATLLDPNYVSTLHYLARAYAMAGRGEEARSTIDRYLSLAAGQQLATGYGAMILPVLGMAEEARAVYERLLAHSRETYLPPGVLGVLAASLGEFDAAFQHFEAGLENRSLVLSWLRDPLLDEFRNDPRYSALMQRAGLEP